MFRVDRPIAEWSNYKGEADGRYHSGVQPAPEAWDLMFGSFNSAAIGKEVRDLRERTLGQLQWYPESSSLTALEIPARLLLSRFDQWFVALRESGAVKIQMGRPLSNREFIEVGKKLGNLIPETAQAVRSFVDDGVVLNLRKSFEETLDVDIQPFAANFITLHSESSLRAASDQPRYLAFTCRVAPETDMGGQTLLLPMHSVKRRLHKADVDILSRTRYRDSQSPPFCYWLSKRLVFSFRDHGEEDLRWLCQDQPEGLTEDRVNAALISLLLAMYGAKDLTGIHWQPDMLVILDNTFFFHGRSRSPEGSVDRPRHIMRLRIQAVEGVAS